MLENCLNTACIIRVKRRCFEQRKAENSVAKMFREAVMGSDVYMSFAEKVCSRIRGACKV